MTLRIPAPSLPLLETAVWAEAQARPWLRLARKSAGKTATGYFADLTFEGQE